MSKLLGGEAHDWSLRRAIDVLGRSARAANRPSALWLTGIVYPDLGRMWSLALAPALFLIDRVIRSFQGLALPAGETVRERWDWLAIGLFVVLPLGLPLFLPVFRLIGGLATLASPRSWDVMLREGRIPKLRTAWQQGRGMSWSTGGLLLLGLCLVSTAWVLLFTPAFGAVLLAGTIFSAAAEAPSGAMTILPWVLCAPSLLLLIAYCAVVSMLLQLGLHSLAQNRRGTASALVHAWRIVRGDPWAAGRTVLVDSMLTLVLWIVNTALSWLAPVPLLHFASVVVWLAVLGYVGVVRALFWSRAYRALGGLSPEDGVPGLQPVAAGATS